MAVQSLAWLLVQCHSLLTSCNQVLIIRLCSKLGASMHIYCTLVEPLCSISYKANCPISSDIGWLDEQTKHDHGCMVYDIQSISHWMGSCPLSLDIGRVRYIYVHLHCCNVVDPHFPTLLFHYCEGSCVKAWYKYSCSYLLYAQLVNAQCHSLILHCRQKNECTQAHSF